MDPWEVGWRRIPAWEWREENQTRGSSTQASLESIQAPWERVEDDGKLKRQQELLDEAYKERISLREVDAKWNPMNDVVEDERTCHMDIISLFLKLRDEAVQGSNPSTDEKQTSAFETG